MWFYSHQQKELFIKGKLYSFSLLEAYSLLGFSWPENNWQRILDVWLIWGKKKRKKKTQTNQTQEKNPHKNSKGSMFTPSASEKNNKNVKVIKNTVVALSGALPVVEEYTNAELTT